jgi:aryl-alcohol dehydrogenase-like predicted oxidoreductase
MPSLGTSDLDVFELCFGGNVFGWSIDKDQSFTVLDAYVDRGGNFIDTADVYSAWIPGNSGGESETIIGQWTTARGNRDSVVIATKVGSLSGTTGLAPDVIARGADASLERLQTDRIDLYYAHQPDDSVPIADTLGAFDALIKAGKIRTYGLSNYSPAQLTAALEAAEREGFDAPAAIQPEYNLVARAYEDGEQDVAAKAGVACVPYYALASGFLTGKYRPGDEVDSKRAPKAQSYMDARGIAVLEALDAAAEAHGVTQAAVALAWLRDRDTVVAPIASARTPEQLDQLLQMVGLTLTAEETAALDAAWAVAA